MRLSLLALILAPTVAAASSNTTIPAFARKYRTSCATCHAPIPRLNAVGEAFAANGFEFKPGEEPRDTIATGDPLLRLQTSLPLAIRYDAYLTALSDANNGDAVFDQKLPWAIKLLSGGQVANKISYYAYFLLTERGKVEGLEDAYIQFTDVGGSGINVVTGQFQVSDPMFKRETRIEFEDYQPYRIRVGLSTATLTYDRGIMATYSPRDGTDVALELVTGQGLVEADAEGHYDGNSATNLVARLSQEFGPLRVGGFGYWGKDSGGGNANLVEMFGPDATLTLGSRAELNVQLLRRNDSNPFMGTCTPAAPCPGGETDRFPTTVDAAFGELIFSPGGPTSRMWFTALANYIDTDRRAVSLGDAYLSRYFTTGLGAHHLLRRNVRTLVEAQWDHQRDQARLVTGFTLAF
jgi:hypothetical protein